MTSLSLLVGTTVGWSSPLLFDCVHIHFEVVSLYHDALIIYLILENESIGLPDELLYPMLRVYEPRHAISNNGHVISNNVAF